MADISKLTLPNGDSYDFKVYTDHIAPMMSKTFTGVIGTANNFANASFYFGKIIPSSFDAIWKIKFNYYSYTNNQELAKGYYELFISGSADALIATDTWNNQKSTSYRPIYNTLVYRATDAGIEAEYGHLLGWRLYSSWQPTTAASARTFEVEIVECVNCTFEFFDTPLKYANVPGTGETNYDGYSEINGTTQGRVRTGQDANDVNYRNRHYYNAQKVTASTPRYMLLVTKGYDDSRLVPITSVSNSTATTKQLTEEEFNPFGNIYYYDYTSIVAAGAVVNGTYLYKQSVVTITYSFNTGSTLVAGEPVYMVCVPQNNGLATLHTDPIANELPSTEDGLLYVFLGYAYDTNRIELEIDHPVYVFKNGKILEISGYSYVSDYAENAGDASTVNGHIVNSDVPANAEFTDTTYSAGSNITLTGTTFSLTKTNVVGALGYTPPEQDTTYELATTSSNGLMSAADKTKIDTLGAVYDATSETITLGLGTPALTITQNPTTGNLNIS